MGIYLNAFEAFFNGLQLGTVLFFILAALGLVGAVGLISSRNPIHSLLFLILNFFAIGGLYLTLHAEFLAVVQIIVYAGAILVLFLFVIMLLNLDETTTKPLGFNLQYGVAYALGFALLGELLYAASGVRKLGAPTAPEVFQYGKVEPIGNALMTDYLFPFEMISVVLLVALMGAIIVAKR